MTEFRLSGRAGREARDAAEEGREEGALDGVGRVCWASEFSVCVGMESAAVAGKEGRPADEGRPEEGRGRMGLVWDCGRAGTERGVCGRLGAMSGVGGCEVACGDVLGRDRLARGGRAIGSLGAAELAREGARERERVGTGREGIEGRDGVWGRDEGRDKDPIDAPGG